MSKNNFVDTLRAVGLNVVVIDEDTKFPEPGTKSPEISDLLDSMSGRTTALRDARCVDVPIGCAKPIVGSDFRDEISRREYRISGLCQHCQDKIFGGPDGD